MRLTILYRGPLESCNYGCAYCPFAKKVEGSEALARDRAALERFVAWAETRPAEDRLSIFFTPWGEALVRPWYQDALARLTHLPAVEKVAIQTNLSTGLGWLLDCDTAKLGLWSTFHPEWADPARFLAQVKTAKSAGVSISVGMVGFKRFKDDMTAMRAALPADVYLWINAVKRSGGPEFYEEKDLQFFRAIDPHFDLNREDHPSLGKDCIAGEHSISVDGDGTMRRCHFVATSIGNLYAGDLESALRPRPCPNQTCGCHIGYVNLPTLSKTFTLERALA